GAPRSCPLSDHPPHSHSRRRSPPSTCTPATGRGANPTSTDVPAPMNGTVRGRTGSDGATGVAAGVTTAGALASSGAPHTGGGSAAGQTGEGAGAGGGAPGGSNR